MEKIFKIGKESKSGKIAGAIRAEVRKEGKLILRMIGPGSCWQGSKAIALAGYSCFLKMNKIKIKDQEIFCLDAEIIPEKREVKNEVTKEEEKKEEVKKEEVKKEEVKKEKLKKKDND